MRELLCRDLYGKLYKKKARMNAGLPMFCIVKCVKLCWLVLFVLHVFGLFRMRG